MTEQAGDFVPLDRPYTAMDAITDYLADYKRGCPLAVIAAQLGHADPRMVEKHYGHLAPSYVADTVRKAFGSLRIVEPARLGRTAQPRGSANSITAIYARHETRRTRGVRRADKSSGAR